MKLNQEVTFKRETERERERQRDREFENCRVSQVNKDKTSGREMRNTDVTDVIDQVTEELMCEQTECQEPRDDIHIEKWKSKSRTLQKSPPRQYSLGKYPKGNH